MLIYFHLIWKYVLKKSINVLEIKLKSDTKLYGSLKIENNLFQIEYNPHKKYK